MFGRKNIRHALPGIRAFLLAPLERRLTKLENKIEEIEYFSHGSRATYVGNNRVLVKAVVARNNIAYYVEADDRLLSPWFIITGAYETELTDYFVKALRPDSHCIDVGANFGYFTCLMGRFCPAGRVIGIEVDEKVYELVRDNVAINGFASFTTVIHAAAADVERELTLHRRITRSGNTSIAETSDDFARSLGEPPAQAFTVNAIPVDSLLDQMGGRVDFMKIDVEGAEPLVLKGAARTIEANPALNIVMEWSPGQIRAAGFEISAFLQDVAATGLRAFDMDGTPLTFDALQASEYKTGIILTRATPL